MELRIKTETVPNPDCMVFHVNFNLKTAPELYLILNEVYGVEHVDGGRSINSFLHRYHFSVLKGGAFDWDEIIPIIKQKIIENQES